MAQRFPRRSKDFLKALARLGYTLTPGHGDHTKATFIAPCADGQDFKFSFPVDHGDLPEGTFHALLSQAGGLTEDHLVQALAATFTEADYRRFIASKTREELMHLRLGRRFRS